ncbi:g10209 [Coccomyxa elongata]
MSLRIQGQEPKEQPVLVLKHRRVTCQENGRSTSAQAQGADALDQHNLFRINTMSEAALRRRIYKIQRSDKLQSFVEILRMKGLLELAEEALEALHSLQRHDI